MIRGRLKMPLATRMTIIFGALILVMFLAVSIVVDRHLTSSTREEVELRVTAMARSLSLISLPYLMGYDYVTLQQIADDALREPDVTQVVVLDKEGLIAGWSGRREKVGQRAEDPISLRGQITLESFCVQEADQEGGKRLVNITPVMGSGGETRWGTIRLSISLRSLESEAETIRTDVLLFALLGFVLAFGVSHLIARRITRPLSTLLKGAEDLARGAWDPDLAIHTGDEIETLAERFRQTADSLERQRSDLIRARDDLAQLNATLEQKVRDRTAQLVESQEKYRLIVEASPDPLCLVQKGTFQFVNRAFLETFGYNEEQVGSPDFCLEKVIHPDFTRPALEVLAHAEETGESIDADWVGIGRGGRSLDFEVRGHRVVWHGEHAIELLWIDLTEKKRLLRQVVQNERLRAIGEMTAMIAHNFNNLLAVVLGRTQLMLGKTEDAFLKRGLEIIRTSALQGGEIVKRIQEYAGNSADLPFREVNIGPLLRDVALYLENLWRVTRGPGAGPVQIELTIDDVPPILGSETLLSDVFKHLLLNAAESMPAGGTVRAAVTAETDSILVRIEDTGIGMSPDVRRRAFDPFFTTKGSRTRGLGLSASYGIIQRHRGRIDLRARESGGTAAEVFLPFLKTNRTSSGPAVDSQVVYMTEEQKTARRLLQNLRSRSGSAGSPADQGDVSPGESRVA